MTADYFKKWPWPLWDTEDWEQTEAAGAVSDLVTSHPGSGYDSLGRTTLSVRIRRNTELIEGCLVRGPDGAHPTTSPPSGGN